MRIVEKIVEINPAIKELVKQNGGYCPCAIVKNEDTRCICKEFKDQKHTGECHCGRYLKVVTEEQTEA